MGAQMDLGEPAGEGSTVVWGVGGEQGGDRSSQQLPSSEEESQRGSMQA